MVMACTARLSIKARPSFSHTSYRTLDGYVHGKYSPGCRCMRALAGHSRRAATLGLRL
jgi:hypothetical protein